MIPLIFAMQRQVQSGIPQRALKEPPGVVDFSFTNNDLELLMEKRDSHLLI